ncbi:MAG: DUF4301 family protein, partial [Syntrophales bacterium]|nr:DUF4301 family protein [Syntrophales bacterium]
MLESSGISEIDLKRFKENLPRYAFYDDLVELGKKSGRCVDNLLLEGEYREVLKLILSENGLNYGNLPKALLKFHRYRNGTRTALEEQIVEAAQYVRDKHNICLIHFTVSENHLCLVKDYVENLRPRFEKFLDCILEISLSTQSKRTDTITLTLDNKPYVLPNGFLFFRPGGHGALFHNLCEIKGDIIFLKNIDNCSCDRNRAIYVHYKKILGGYLLHLQYKIFSLIEVLNEGHPDESELSLMEEFCKNKLFINLERTSDFRTRKEQLLNILNRPLRVCGVVRNEGEPGGGPFWVKHSDGRSYPQIVEESQVDFQNISQRDIWQSATHFNPVDIVCGVKDHKGRNFDLRRFSDPETYTVSIKSERGQEIKALEYPGLWNGSMAFWNTVFVEAPIDTFNPVKVVDDLLRFSHQACEL